MKGRIFNLLRFCLNDGPGIRTTVFFKGCPLHCEWCHNPESLSFKSELLFNAEKCVGCGKCAAACKNGVHLFENGRHLLNRNGCELCGECVEACRFAAVEIAGKETEASEIVKEALKDLNFYKNSGGGVTLSGGEPMAQPEFAFETASALKKAGISVAIETSGMARSADFERIAAVTDLFLYDIKLSSEELYKRHTGGSLKTVLGNLRLLNSLGKDIILRLPLIPEINGNEEHFRFAASLANELCCVKGVEIMPYHSLGTEKAVRAGKTERAFKVPEKEEIDGYIKALQVLTSKPVKRG